tara:strand:+ start:31 stop:1095 length:1065 start_codon:yes stop_codon:yes gene_type:complete
MKHTCSLSGGRTSTGPLPAALIKKYGKENVDFIFCDTGAEDKDTYRFVRDAEKLHGVKITCLKLVMPKEKGKGCTYIECTTKDIKQDLFAWKQLSSKYGNPFIPGGKFCTNEMKTVIYSKYCKNTYGKGNYYTWLGYRYEEGNRIWGRDASNALGKLDLSNIEKTEFFLDCLAGNTEKLLDEYFPSMFPSIEDEKQKNYIRKSLNTSSDKNFRYMPEVCELIKSEVIGWWSGNELDLQIADHLGNCLFCMEKPPGTVMLAIKDRPEEAKEFLHAVESDDVAKKDRKEAFDVMYRNGTTFRWLYEKAQKLSRDEILQMSQAGKKIAKKNSCSGGECSPFGTIHEDQIDLFVSASD